MVGGSNEAQSTCQKRICFKEYLPTLFLERDRADLYTGQDPTNKVKVVIKKVSFEGNTVEMENVECLREIKVAHVVEFYRAFIEENSLYIVMQYCEHGDLRMCIETHAANNTHIDDKSIIKWSRELMLVMVFLHNKSIVHNDIKPEYEPNRTICRLIRCLFFKSLLCLSRNILLDDSKNSILLADVGEAQVINIFKTTDSRGGTPIYMAPERLKSSHGSASIKSDVWSCAIVMYELINLKRPFDDLFNHDSEIHHDESRWIGKLFKPILNEMLAKEPEKRPKPAIVLDMLGFDEPIREALTEPNARSINCVSRIKTDLPRFLVESYIEIISLETIEEAFENKNMVLLTGVGGSGKTTLANEYAKSFLNRSDDAVVVWFSADSADKILLQLRSILIDELDVKETKLKNLDEKGRLNVVTKHVNDAKTPHIFVFDNIEEEAMELILFISKSMSNNFRVLLTSRNKEINRTTRIDIGLLNMNHVEMSKAKKYLNDRIGAKVSRGTREQIFDELIKPLSQLTPFYLKSVIASLEMHIDTNNGIEPNQFQKLIKDLKSFDISDLLLSNVRDSVSCQRVLEVVQFLDPDEIAMDALELLVEGREAAKEGAATLEKYHVISSFFSNDQKYINIHRLLVNSINKRLSNKEQAEVRLRVIRTILEEVGDISNENFLQVKRFQKHMFKLLKDNEDASVTILELYEKVAMIEKTYNFNYTKEIELRNKLLDLSEIFYADQSDHPNMAESLSRLATAYEKAGKYTDAIRLGTNALKMNRRIHFDHPDHFEIAKCSTILAMAYLKSGNYSEAIKIFRETQRIYQGKPDHPDIAKNLSGLANSYKSVGDYAAALQSHQDSLRMLRRIHEDQPDHPDVAWTLSNQAIVCVHIQNYSKAIEVHIEALEMRRRIHSGQPDHPEIGESLNNLATAYNSAGNYSKAIEKAEESLAIKRRAYANQPDHFSIASTLSTLANAYYGVGNYTKAIKLLKESLEIKEKLLNEQPEHPRVARCLTELATVYESRGNLLEALRLYKRALIMHRKIFNEFPNNPFLVKSSSGVWRVQVNLALIFFMGLCVILELFNSLLY